MKELYDELATNGMEDIGADGLASINKKLTPTEIQEWLTELGSAKMKKVTETYGGTAMKHYGKDWMRDYKGFTSNTDHHVTVGDGLSSSSGVSGCHDYDTFMSSYVTPRPEKIHVHAQTSAGPLEHFDYSVMKADGSGPKAAHREKTTIQGLAANWGTLRSTLEKEVNKQIKNMIFPRTAQKGTTIHSGGQNWNYFFRDSEIATIFPVL